MIAGWKGGDTVVLKSGEIVTLLRPGNQDATWWFVDFEGIEDEVNAEEFGEAPR